jgi:hypothetical protein
VARQVINTLRRNRAPIIFAALLLALCFGPTQALANGEFEPNDSEETAYGPLVAGTTYSATLENGDDLDNFFFYVTGEGETPVHVTITDTTPGGDGLYAELSDDEDVIDELDVFGDDFDSFDEDLPAGKYFLSLETETFEQTNETYEIQVEGGNGAFVSESAIHAQCGSSTANVAKAKAALRRAKRKLKRARKSHSAHRKIVARRAVKIAKANLRDARSTAAQNCAISG